MPTDFDTIHASGRYDRVPTWLHADVTSWRATTDATIITGTEWERLTAAQKETVLGGPDWDHHVTRGNGVAWRVDTWEFVSADDVKLSDLQYRRATGSLFPKFYATVVVLRHVVTGQLITVFVVHMPTRNTKRRREVWADVAAGMVRLVLALKTPVLVAADFNAGWRIAADRALLEQAFDRADVDFGWAGRVPAGVKISLIDGHAVRGLKVRSSRLLAAAKAAEGFHRPVLIGLSLPTPTTPPATVPDVPKENPVSDNRYEIITFRGRRMDRYTAQALRACEEELEYELTITQGSYNAGKVSASAGTHDQGGVIDLKAWDGPNKVRVLREIGCFAAWFRDDSEGPWPDHIHAAQIGNAKLSPSAARQVQAYRIGRNGLANNGRDRGPRPTVIRPFVYVEHEHKPGARDLNEGCKGPDVAFVQRVVGVRPDRDFGPKTKAAVKAWERKQLRLLADGIVGVGTWKRMGVKPTYTPGKKKAA